jgi:hypothetical protein
MTSKFVMATFRRLLKQFAGQRLSGLTETEKKLPLSATIAPYFFSAFSTTFSCFVQFAGMAKDDLSRVLTHG